MSENSQQKQTTKGPQKEWIKPEDGSRFERWRNYDTLPAIYKIEEDPKGFLKKPDVENGEDQFKVDSATDPMDGGEFGYSVKYWPNTESFSVSRWPKGKGNGGGTGSYASKFEPRYKWKCVQIEQGEADYINKLLKENKAGQGEFWKILESPREIKVLKQTPSGEAYEDTAFIHFAYLMKKI